MKGLTYVAMPYTGTHEEIQERMNLFLAVDAHLILQGRYTVSPLSKHFSLEHGLGANWADWKDYSYTLIDRCEEMYVIDCEGWDKSVGVLEEIHYARTRGMRITFHYASMHGGLR